MGYFIILQDKYYKIQLISENEKRIVPDIKINEVKLIDHGEENDAVKACNSFLYFQRYVIQIITDNRVDQVKKTYRQFQYFNKILHKKMGLKDNLLALSKHIKSTNNFRELQLYIQRLNSGYLLYRATQQIQARRNANIDFFSKKTTNDVFQLQPIKTRQLRNYLYDLLYREDQLFVDGLQSDSGSDISPPKQIVPNGSSIKTEFVKQTVIQNPKQKEKSRNPLKNLFHGSPFDKALQKAANTTVGGGVANQIQRQQVNLSQAINMTKSGVERKSNTPSKFKKAFLNLAYKAKMTGQKGQNLMTNNHEQTNLRGILRNITKCWIKFPNSYNNRDRNVIYKPYIWQQYDFKISDNIIEFTNNSSVHRHRKIFVIFQCDVELNFQEYTKLIIKNKIDKNPLEIRLSLDDNLSTVTQQYLSLYTYIKQTVKQQEEKLKMVSPNEKNSKVCNKVRIRIGLKRKTQKANSSNSNGSQSPVISGQQFNMSRRNASQLFLNFPHGQKSNDQKQQFQFKQIRQPPANLSKVQVKIIQSTINVVVTISLDSYVDIDLPILDNFGALDIIVSEVPKQTGFLPGKQVLCTFHMPVQTVYDYMYGYQIPKKRKNQLKTKMMQIQNTKVNLTFDYTCIGNYYALCSYNQNDIFEDDQPPQQFNKDQFRMNNNRLKRIVWSIQLYLERFKDLRNFTYPNLSYLFYIYIAVSCLFYDNNNFLLWIFLLLLAVLFYNSPAYNLYLSSLIDILKMKAKKKRLDTVLFKKNKLIQDEYVIPMKKVAKIQFLQQFILTRKVKRSIYKKYKRLLQVLLQAQILLTKIVSFVQKIKNIFVWYHYKKTKLLFTFIAIMAFSLLVLPIRFILFLVVLKTMSKGAKYHSRIQDLNKVIIIQLLRIIIRQNNFNLMSLYFKQIYRPFEFHNPETFSFFKTCKTSLSDWLQVNIQMDVIIRKSTNMSEFITNLTKCKIKYKIRKEICQQYGFSLQWAKNQSSATKTFDLIYGFIVTIPSDKYIMGVKTVSGNDEQQLEQVDNIIDRQLLNF